jgi:CBS domain-containing protein
MSRISEWMTRDPETVSADLDSEEAAQIMLSRGFRHLPVLDGNAVVGIVSLRDVLSTRIRRAAK